MKRNDAWRKTMLVSLSLALTVPALAACTKANTGDANKETVLRIASGYGPDDEWFRSQFTEIFEFANPNIKVEIVPLMEEQYRYQPPKEGEKPVDPYVKMKELLESANPPDLVMINLEQLPNLIGDNLLQPLDPLMQRDQFDTSDFVPAVIEGVKKMGDGKLYAMAPLFSSSAMFYNKKLFADAGVPEPTDNMTWDQVFDLAKRMTRGEGDNKTYGFSFSNYSNAENLFHEMYNYTNPLQLTVFDSAGEKMTVDSDQWERVWSKMLDLNKSGIFPVAPDYSQPRSEPRVFRPFEHDSFLSGKTAMVVSYFGYLNEIVNANKNAANIDGFNPVDWDVVTMPTHPEAPGVGGNIYLNGLMGINAKAQNPEDAWKFLKFVNGDDWAKLKSRSAYQLVSRKSYIQPKEGLNYNINAFYQLTPAPQPDNTKLYREKPYIGQVQSIGQQYFQQMIRGEKGVRDALKEWQAEGDKMLQQMKDNPNQPVDMGTFPIKG